MQEFAARREANARYSLRAFAALLGTDHASLSQIMRGKRAAPPEHIGAWGRRLKLSPEESAVYAALARIADERARAADEALRHWAVEMLALLSEPVHREILRLTRTTGFKNDSRWLAAKTGATVDAVNIALSRLLRLRLLASDTDGVWRDTTSLDDITPLNFRRYIAERVPSPLTKED
jgi:hypothetical protein